MKFFAVNGTRPVRLSEATRKYAYESMNHKYGLEAKATPYVHMDDIENFETLTELEKYDAAIEKIARCAPIRICDGEKLSGAATLGDGIVHLVPARYKDKVIFASVSHLTADFESVVKCGVNSIRKQSEAALERYRGTENEAFVRSCLNCLDAMQIWHRRYLDALENKPEYASNYRNLQRVPFEPATNFYEAVQSIWFTFAFMRLTGNWPGIGRIDWLLGEYLEKDLAAGVITEEEAREILAHFFIKGCEWICGTAWCSGDAQHYQNILLAGVDGDGKEITNTVTYLVLEVLEELGISDFPTTVRISAKSEPKLLKRVAEVIRLGGGVLAVYNEDLVLDALTGYGYDPAEAWKFANDGCWEVQIPGKTYFSYIPFDGLAVLQDRTLRGYGDDVCFDDFASLYQAYIRDLKDRVCEIMDERHHHDFVEPELPVDQWEWSVKIPCTVVSLFEQGCIEKGLSYYEGGPVYHVTSPHIGGLPDVVNSLYAIKKLVFDDQKVSFDALMEILRNNWEGHEDLRLYAVNRYNYFGNDNDEVDCISQQIIEDFADICDAIGEKSRHITPAGVSTFGRQLEWSAYRLATPFGKKANTVLAGNFSPTPGTDKEGATAIIKSYCKANLRRTVTGAALDVKLLPASVNCENGVDMIVSLLRGFVTLGGFFMQLDVADTELLKAAQEHPEDYRNLSVRVSGWNARFVTLDKAWQDMIIAQTGSQF